ncbi:MAG: hypothetical protein KAT65_23985, partial [Methanophagales archaeon]|nr:hypothetical protein [Methanophagales archaeon]
NIAGLIAIAAIVVVMMLSGCTDKEQINTAEVKEELLNSAEIKEMILDSVEKIDTYKFDIDLTEETLIRNETDETEMTTVSTGKAVVDIANKMMSMKMTSSIETPDKAEMPEGPMEMTMNGYFINNTLYRKDGGIPAIPAQWMKAKIPEGYDDFWESQNLVNQQVEMLNDSTVELLDDEVVNGVDCYVLKITPEMEKYGEVMMMQGGIVYRIIQGLQQNENFDITKAIKSKSVKQWIAKDTLFPMKTEMQMKMVINTEDLNLPDTEEAVTVTSDQKTTLVFYDYNKPANIELPEDAKNASAFPMFPPMKETTENATEALVFPQMNETEPSATVA